MATQSSPHPRITSAYARETPAAQRALNSSHQRSNSLPLAQYSRGRHNTTPVPYKQGSAQTPCASADAYSDRQLPIPPGVLKCKYQDNLDAASITAVKSREVLKLKKTKPFAAPSDGRPMSSVDEMVISSWGGGRRRCLDALLDVRGQPEDMQVQSFELSTPPASLFPLPPMMPRSKLTNQYKQRANVPRRQCSSLVSEHQTMGIKVHAFHHVKSTAPLMIQKKMGVNSSTGSTGNVSNSTWASHQDSMKPSAATISCAFDLYNTEMEVIKVDPGFRAIRCPPNIKGNPRNRI